MRMLKEFIDFGWQFGIAVRAGSRRNAVRITLRQRRRVPFPACAKAKMALRAWVRKSKRRAP